MAEEERGYPEPSVKAVSGQDAKASLNPGVALGGFLQDTQKELGQVTWPSRQQLISESIAVIAMVALSATLVYFLDDIFSKVQAVVFPS
jgi:preprotein translocase subunit SecE